MKLIDIIGKEKAKELKRIIEYNCALVQRKKQIEFEKKEN